MSDEATDRHGTVPAALDDASMLRCVVFRDGKSHGPPSNLSDLSNLLSEDRTLVWLDLVDPKESDLTLLAEEFKLHPLAIEDAVSAHERPKVDEYDGYWFIVIHGVTSEASKLVLHEIAMFVGKQFLVTVRHAPAYPLDEIERRWRAHPEALRKDVGFLLYVILDTVVDGYFPVAEEVRERIDQMETTLFQGQPLDNALLRNILVLKRDVQEFRRAVLPMRDILNPIIRGDLGFFPKAELAYFRDVYDHAVRVIDQVDAARDLVSTVLEIHLSVVANRQNEINKQLTIIATIFLPLTFITGFFGQNFGLLVTHISSAWTFWVWGIGSEVVALIIMLVYFKLRRWF
jgi:magnesium transporter